MISRLSIAVAVGLLLTTAQGFAAANNSPPAGAILDLAGGETGTPVQTINHNSSAPTTESITFTAGNANTDITFALREDPAFILLSNISLVDITHPSANLILNGDFSGGTTTSNGNTLAAVHWTFDNVFGAGFSGVVASGSGSCGPAFAFCWDDGSVQAYDAIDQVVATTIGDNYTLSFQYWDNGDLSLFSDLSTNGDISGTGGNGADLLAYAGAGLPVACQPGVVCTGPTPIPEPLTLSLFGAGLTGAAIMRRRRRKQ